MGEYKLVIPSDAKLNLKYSGEYNKFNVAQNIAKAINQAKLDGFGLNYNSWKSGWDLDNLKWTFQKAHNWCGLLASILIYSDCNYFGSKIEATANVLGVEKEWLLGFTNTLAGSYESVTNRVCKRKSKKGQHCRDGREFGKIFKLAYLPDMIFEFNFAKTTEEFFNTHTWEPLEECKTFLSLGMNYNKNIKKCTQCNMYGGMNELLYHKEKHYYINDVWDTDKYKFREFWDLSCNEITIKNLLT